MLIGMEPIEAMEPSRPRPSRLFAVSPLQALADLDDDRLELAPLLEHLCDGLDELVDLGVEGVDQLALQRAPVGLDRLALRGRPELPLGRAAAGAVVVVRVAVVGAAEH